MKEAMAHVLGAQKPAGRKKVEEMHIKKAHGDYETVMASPKFASYLATLEGEDKARADEVIDHGTTDEVVQLFADVKAWMQSHNDEGGDAIDKAENRQRFRDAMTSIGLESARSGVADRTPDRTSCRARPGPRGPTA